MEKAEPKDDGSSVLRLRRVDEDDEDDEAVVRASLVKRSEMDLSCKRGGSMMWTSGSRQRGSWIRATVEAARTCTGMDCVIVVSRSWERRPESADESPPAFESAWREKLASSVVTGGTREKSVLVMMVRERRGTLSFFVRRIEAEEPPRAERRARASSARGTWRLMALFGVADWMVYDSKILSYARGTSQSMSPWTRTPHAKRGEKRP